VCVLLEILQNNGRSLLCTTTMVHDVVNTWTDLSSDYVLEFLHTSFQTSACKLFILEQYKSYFNAISTLIFFSFFSASSFSRKHHWKEYKSLF